MLIPTILVGINIFNSYHFSMFYKLSCNYMMMCKRLHTIVDSR